MAKIKPDQRLVGKVMDPIPGMCKLPLDQRVPCWLDGRVRPAPQDVISCANGLLNINTRELVPHTPAYFTLTRLDFEYDANAPEPERWLKFLDEVWPGDSESQGALQEMFGYYLTTDTRQQKAHVMIGPKRSGKGTIAYVLGLLLGEDNVVGPLITSLSRQFGLEPLIGKTLAIVPDARVSNRTDTAPIVEALLAITGEDKVSVARKNKTDWHGRLGTRLLILSNKVPDVVDEGGVLPARFIVLDMKESFFGREDITLKDTLKEEIPGIMNLALDGLRSLRARGKFMQPEAGKKRLGDIEDMTAPGPSFVRDRLIVTGTASVVVDGVWREWQDWCEEKDRDPGHKSELGKLLRQTLGDKISDYRPRDKNMPDGRGPRHYRGIALRYQE
jgi:P4 family phage/plasmid primase-like protien